nr:hypothetical protein [Thomasclavelia saccharogumia]
MLLSAIFAIVEKGGQSISGNDKKAIKQCSLLDKIEAQLSRDGKDDMVMFGFKSHRADISSMSLTGFRTTFGTVFGTAGMSNNSFFATVRTDKEIITKMDRRTKDNLLNVIKRNISKFTFIM